MFPHLHKTISKYFNLSKTISRYFISPTCLPENVGWRTMYKVVSFIDSTEREWRNDTWWWKTDMVCWSRHLYEKHQWLHPTGHWGGHHGRCQCPASCWPPRPQQGPWSVQAMCVLTSRPALQGASACRQQPSKPCYPDQLWKFY